MKRYLMRGGMSPIHPLSPETVIERNSIGTNAGNMLYLYGVYRTLLTEECTIDIDAYAVEKGVYSAEDIARINEEYDAYICPLADAFRNDFIDKLERYEKFFRQLTIPCYEIGCGLKAPYEPQVSEPKTFDKAVKGFVSAVLEKSALIGLRGEITGDYLRHLGFREGNDYSVIGCPSLYIGGGALTQRPFTLSKETAISFNLAADAPHNVMAFAVREMDAYINHYLVEQNIGEARLLFFGTPFGANKSNNQLLPRDISHPLLQENRYKFFVNAPTWINFLKTVDLSVGCKLHGNIAAIIAGTPAIFVTLDSRMREITAYHALPAIPYMEVGEETRIQDLLEQLDMRAYMDRHSQNFQNFVGFLNRNGLSHIYEKDVSPQRVPLDEAITQISFPYIQPALSCTTAELVQRFENVIDHQNTIIKNLRKRNKKLEQEIDSAQVQEIAKFSSAHPHFAKWLGLLK